MRSEIALSALASAIVYYTMASATMSNKDKTTVDSAPPNTSKMLSHGSVERRAS